MPDELQAYSFKGLQLGVTIEQARAFPFFTKHGAARLKCTCDPDGQQMARVYDPNIGGATCQYVAHLPVPTPRLFGGWKQEIIEGIDTVTLAGVDCEQVFLNFIPANGTLRLLEIRAIFPQQAFPAVKSAYVERYGAPYFDVSEPVTNGFGVRFINQRVAWKNGTTYVQLSRFGPDLTRSLVTYIDVQLFYTVKDRLQQWDILRSRDL